MHTIGSGTFAKVKLCKHTPTDNTYAMKIFVKSQISEMDFIFIERELHFLKELKHDNIINLIDTIDRDDKYFIITEYCESGELFNMIVDNGRLSCDTAASFYYQLISGLEYIHNRNVVHRDIKPENLLIKHNKYLKIIDFGLSNYIPEDGLLETPCGSLSYASPEMISGNLYNGVKHDIWSTGVVLYVMLCGCMPFGEDDNELLFQKITNCEVEYPEFLEEDAKMLMKKILVKNYDERLTIAEIKEEAFYIRGKRVYEGVVKETTQIMPIISPIIDNNNENRDVTVPMPVVPNVNVDIPLPLPLPLPVVDNKPKSTNDKQKVSKNKAVKLSVKCSNNDKAKRGASGSKYQKSVTKPKKQIANIETDNCSTFTNHSHLQIHRPTITKQSKPTPCTKITNAASSSTKKKQTQNSFSHGACSASRCRNNSSYKIKQQHHNNKQKQPLTIKYPSNSSLPLTMGGPLISGVPLHSKPIRINIQLETNDNNDNKSKRNDVNNKAEKSSNVKNEMKKRSVVKPTNTNNIKKYLPTNSYADQYKKRLERLNQCSKNESKKNMRKNMYMK